MGNGDANDYCAGNGKEEAKEGLFPDILTQGPELSHSNGRFDCKFLAVFEWRNFQKRGFS